MTKQCINCSADFTAKRSTAQFCSTKCRVDFGRREKGATPLESQFVRDTARVMNRVRVPVPKNSDAGSTPKVQSGRNVSGPLDEVNQDLESKGLPKLRKGSDIPLPEFLPSGIPEIDQFAGGFPRSSITEIFGPKGVGKTSLMRMLASSLAGSVLYVDAEGGLPYPPPELVVSNDYILEEVENLVETALRTQKFDAIIVDSIASLVPRAELTGEPGDAWMGLKARLMGQWMRRVNYYLSKTQTALIFINQQRESMEIYGPRKFTPGGHAVPYAASLRLELKTTKADRFSGGHHITVMVEKTRVCEPYQTSRFKLHYPKSEPKA